MKSYFLEEFENKEKYNSFIEYMLTYSDTFSLVYFKYRENEKLNSNVKKIKELLRPYKIFAVNGNQWPSTVTLNQNNHIYNVVLYRADMDSKVALLKAVGIFEWDYPAFPMDLCFYRNGYAWFSLSAHEHIANLFLEDDKTFSDLTDLGINLYYECDIDNSKLFFERAIMKTEDGSMS